MSYDYDDLNQSELIELCHKKGVVAAHPGIERDDLISLLEGRADQWEFSPDPVNISRGSMMEFLTEFPRFREQMRCTMFCWECPSAMASACATFNCEPDLIEKVRRGDRKMGD